jgi:putative phosphoribosyl transferase
MKDRGISQLPVETKEISLQVKEVALKGDLNLPQRSRGLVIFAHGSGSSRKSPRNRSVATVLNDSGLATLLFDLLTEREESIDMYTGQLRFDIDLLAGRLAGVTVEMRKHKLTSGLKIGFFGASTGAAAAIVAAAEVGRDVSAVVSRGGRPDLAEDYLAKITAPTLLIVGGHDYEVIRMNRDALSRINAVKEMQIVPGATHLFEEPGALEIVSKMASDWFTRYLKPEK